MRLLLVDDNPIDREILETFIHDFDSSINIMHAEHGEEAIALLLELPKKDLPNLILLDLHMPIMDGLDFLDAKSNLNHIIQAIPTLVLANTGIAQNVLRSYIAGANAFIERPIAPSLFRKIIKSIFAFWNDVALLP